MRESWARVEGTQNKEKTQVGQWLLTDFRKFTKIIHSVSKAC